MLEFGERLTVSPADLTREDVDRLRRHGFDDRAILSVTLAAAYRNYITRVADALGVELRKDGGYSPEILHAFGVKAGTGTAQAAQYDIAGSGDIDAGAVDARDLKVSIAGSGGIKAHSSGTADVSIMGSGDVDVAGGAKCKVSKAGSGDVRCS